MIKNRTWDYLIQSIDDELKINILKDKTNLDLKRIFRNSQNLSKF